MRGAWIALAGCAVLCTAGCSDLPLRKAGSGMAVVELTATPFFPQRRYQCGPAALATVLVASGVDTDADALVPEVYLPGRKGSLQAELLGATRRHERIPYLIPPQPEALIAELEAGRPVLVLQNFGSRRAPIWHYAVVIGHDRDQERFILRSGTTRRAEIAARRFLATWQRADGWALVTLKPGELPVDAKARPYLEAVSGLEATGHARAAAQAYAAATRRWPEEPLGWFGLANARLAQGASREAEAAYRQALDLDPAQAAARNNLALLLARRGCSDAAKQEIALARLAAADSPLAAEIEASTQEIDALRKSGSITVAGDCPFP